MKKNEGKNFMVLCLSFMHMEYGPLLQRLTLEPGNHAKPVCYACL
jgi:hypothetical protein